VNLRTSEPFSNQPVLQCLRQTSRSLAYRQSSGRLEVTLIWRLYARRRRRLHYANRICLSQGRIQEFWKGGPGKGVKPRTERRGRERPWEASPENFLKIRCDFMQSGIYFWDQNGLGCHSKWGLYRTKNSSGHDFDSHTHAYTLILLKTPRISATIKSKFNFKHNFPDIVYNVKNKIDFVKNRETRAPRPPGSATVSTPSTGGSTRPDTISLTTTTPRGRARRQVSVIDSRS